MNKLKINILYTAFYQAFILIIPLITLPYLTRIFNPNDLGINSYISSIIQIFITISFWGINNYGGRAIAFQKSKADINQTFWEIWIIQLFFSALSFISFILLVIIIKPVNLHFYLIQSFLIILVSLEVSWFFVGIEEMKKVVLRNTVMKILTTIFIFIFIKNENDLWKYMFINVVGTLLGNLSLIISLKKYIFKFKIAKSNINKHLKQTSLFLIPQFAILIYTTLDKTLLGYFCDLTQVGYYDQAQRIIRIIIVFITSATTALMPRMSSLVSSNKKNDFRELFEKSFKYILFICFLFTIITISIANPFVSLFFGKEYIQVIPLMRLVALIGILIPLGTLLWNGLLIPQGYDKIIVKSTLYAALISLGLNIILDFWIGAYGAAIALIATELFIFLYRLNFSRKIFDFKIFNHDFLQFSLVAIIVISLNEIIFTYISELNNFLVLCILGGNSVILFIISLLCFKNSTILLILKDSKVYLVRILLKIRKR